MIPVERLTLKARAARALADPSLRKAVRFTVERLRTAKSRSTDELEDWEEWREQGREVRQHVVDNLDFYLDQFTAKLEDGGHAVHFASDAAEAQRVVLDIARRSGAKLAVKSKSMVSEELHLNAHLADAGVECLETDLGEWIIQLAHEAPSHLIIPAIHKNRLQVKALFEADGGTELTPETSVLAGYARQRLRAKFAQADLGITGCNFAIADTGSVVLFTNEGNGRMVTTLPKIHIVVMGMERVLPNFDDLELMANLLPRSATGQKITTYLNIITGARGPEEVDGASELHVIVLDNGRSRQLGDREFQSILNCIRCGACLNVCPVYRHMGGHAYASTYSGPIGAVLTPLLEPTPASRELANASTLCGACSEACPVKIPLHDMLVHQRRKNVENGVPAAERAAFWVFALVFSRPRVFGFLSRIGRFFQRTFVGDASRPRFMSRLLPPLRNWTRHRNLPVPPVKAFRDHQP